jgi:hypothetical protein
LLLDPGGPRRGEHVVVADHHAVEHDVGEGDRRVEGGAFDGLQRVAGHDEHADAVVAAGDHRDFVGRRAVDH